VRLLYPSQKPFQQGSSRAAKNYKPVMKIALMQPYFFPYVGYFQLIAAVDRFVLFDDAQYMKGGWINRNRILKPHGGPQYINLPVIKHGSRAPIKEIRAKGGYDWKALVLRQLEHYRKKAPFFHSVIGLLEECFAFDEVCVTQLNGHYLRAICAYVGLPFQIEVSSKLQLNYDEVATADDWTLAVSRGLGATEFVNPIGGAKLFEENKFTRHDIKLTFLRAQLPEYDQRMGTFEPALSIIDVLMFNDRQTTRKMFGAATLI
jgi:WbqC-like protein family